MNMTNRYNCTDLLAKERRSESDYSSVVTTYLRLSYITPTGKFAYEEVSLANTTPIKALKKIIRNIAKSTSTPPIIIE